MLRIPYRSGILLGLLPAVALAVITTLTYGHAALAQTAAQGPGTAAAIAGLWLVHHDPTNPAAADLAIFQNRWEQHGGCQCAAHGDARDGWLDALGA